VESDAGLAFCISAQCEPEHDIKSVNKQFANRTRTPFRLYFEGKTSIQSPFFLTNEMASNSKNRRDFEVRPVSFRRSLVVDAGYLSHNRHVIHGLVEVDVTRGHNSLREMATRNPSTKPSFTAFLVASSARAIAADPSVQALKAPRGRRVVVFRDVDVVTMIEPGAGAVAIPHIIRNANLKSVMEITKEIRAIQSKPTTSHQQGGAIDVAARMPRWTRMLAYRWFRASPHRFKEMQGTAMLTSVGMFGRGGSSSGADGASSGFRGGFGIGFLTVHTIGMTVGGIARRLVLADDGHVENHEFLSLTLSFDHDLVDGAPAARFTSRLVDILESAAALDLPEQDQKIAIEDAVTLDTLHL
jgi:pyruvate/2-oxoglutarate dehydrogenase complex dihydrolipoamide acyltransferase (E2) component